MTNTMNDWKDGLSVFDANELLEKVKEGPDMWEEVTCPASGDGVFVYFFPKGCEEYSPGGTAREYLEDEKKYLVDLADGNTVKVERVDFDLMPERDFPSGLKMYSFPDATGLTWLEKGDGIRLMSNCGFRVFRNDVEDRDKPDYYFGLDEREGIDAAGCWDKLYQLRNAG